MGIGKELGGGDNLFATSFIEPNIGTFGGDTFCLEYDFVNPS